MDTPLQKPKTKHQGEKKKKIKYLTANHKSPNPLRTVPRLQLFSWLHMCVKGGRGRATIRITAIFLINNARLAFQSSWAGQWELCSKLYLSFYNDSQACSRGHNTPGTI